MATMAQNKNAKVIVTVLIVAVLAVLAFAFLNMPDRRGPGEKIGDAISQVGNGNGLDDAARELQDRTPGERIKDGIEDATDGSPQ